MTQVIARVHPVHLMNAGQRQAAATLRPIQPTWAVSLPVWAATVYIHNRTIIFLTKVIVIQLFENNQLDSDAA